MGENLSQVVAGLAGASISPHKLPGAIHGAVSALLAVNRLVTDKHVMIRTVLGNQPHVSNKERPTQTRLRSACTIPSKMFS